MSFSTIINGHTLTFDSAAHFVASIPPGMIFRPSESELVCSYLCAKIYATLNDVEECLVQTCDIYGEEEPWEIWERLAVGNNSVGDAGLHVFTKLKKTADGSVLRTVGVDGGTWDEDEDGPSEPSELEFDGNIVLGRDGKIITWQRRSFIYQNPRSPLHHGCWTMQEYSCSLSDDLVVVAIKSDAPPTSPVAAVEYTKPKPRNKRKGRKVPKSGGKSENSGV